MSSVALKICKLLGLRSGSATSTIMGLRGGAKRSFSTSSSISGDDNDNDNDNDNDSVGAGTSVETDDDNFLPERPELQLQGVDPRKGWNFRGVHRAILCGKVGQAPVQKMLRNGNTVTIFTVGTGGMFDQRTLGSIDLPKPAQWHRIAVHNPMLGTYSVQQLVKNSSVYVEGDIEVRVYNDSINGEIKSVPEICVRRDGRIRLIKTGENKNSFSIDELREGLL